MHCHDFESRFEAFLGGELPAGERSACEEHLGHCPACRELLELAELSFPAADERDDLVAPVLERTSGSPCLRAGELLASRLDAAGGPSLAEPPDPLARELLDLHLASCPDCRSLARVLTALARDLPGLAEVRPDPAFVADVLARSLPSTMRWRRALSRTWSQRWSAWVRRPRFAWEAAFVLTLAFLPVLTSSASPVVETAREMAERTAEPPVAERLGRLEREVAAAGRALLDLGPVETAGETVRAAVESLEGLGVRAEAWAGARLEDWGTLRAGAASFLEKAADGEILPERPDETSLTEANDTRAGDGSKGDPR